MLNSKSVGTLPGLEGEHGQFESETEPPMRGRVFLRRFRSHFAGRIRGDLG